MTTAQTQSTLCEATSKRARFMLGQVLFLHNSIFEEGVSKEISFYFLDLVALTVITCVPRVWSAILKSCMASMYSNEVHTDIVMFRISFPNSGWR